MKTTLTIKEDIWTKRLVPETKQIETKLAINTGLCIINRKETSQEFYQEVLEAFSPAQTLVGRIENIQDDFVIIGFDVLEENRREYYPFKKDMLSFEYFQNDLVTLFIYEKPNNTFQYEFKPYKQSPYFEEKENRLRESFDDIRNCDDDDF